MEISIAVPDDAALLMKQRWHDLPRRALEALVADAYREGVLSGAQVQRILGFESRFEVDAFLKRSGVYLNYTADDLEHDLQAARRATGA